VAWLVKPPRPIKAFATRIHGISAEDVASAPAFADIRHEVRQALGGRVLVAHNAHVDTGVLGRELGEWEYPEVFDTLKLARRLLPGQPSYKLGALVKALSLDGEMPSGLVPHRAAYDVLVTARLFVRLATRHDGNPVSLEELRGRGANRNPGGADEIASLF
jgi:exodeoxyribonuclease X